MTVPIGALHDIAEQAGANDFHEFCRWIDQTVWIPGIGEPFGYL